LNQDWLQIARNQAEERFRSLPFPNAKDENFRFTPFEYKPLDGAASGAAPVSIASLDEEEGALLSLEGDEGELKGQVQGYLFTDLLRSATLGSEAVRQRLRESDLFRDDKFAQLTAARWRNGAFLHVPAGVKVQKPIRFAVSSVATEEHFRHLVVLEEGAEATLIQECWSDDAARFVGELTEVKLGRGSRLHWVVMQNNGSGTDSVVRQRIDLAAEAELRYTPLHLGGRLTQVRQESHLAGEGASFETSGAARGGSNQHFDFWLDARHEAPRSRSKMDYWFVMAGKSRGVFNGLIEVKHGASDCESSQRSKSLLLGQGTVHTIPKLLIKTDAVKAAHGASVSSVSFEQLHYLQSRGITRIEAERMIVRGFTEGVVERLPTEGLRGRADAALDQKQGTIHAQ
jgi:Fe-S cluster assembly scaffold protein SufB